MTDETSQLIIGDAAVEAASRADPTKQRWLRRRRKVAIPLTHCENCATPLTGPFCSVCGQHAIDYRRSFARVFLDVLDSFLNWDSKFFATIGLLLVRPWRLTNAFNSGQRVRYVHPLRLYLLISIAFFFGVHQLAQHAPISHADAPAAASPEKKARLEKKLARLPDEMRTEITKDLAQGEMGPSLSFSGNDDGKNSSPFEKWLNDRVKTKIGEKGINAKVFMLTLVSNLPGMMLCCIPLFAFVLKTLYVRRRVLYIDHLIYALHIHAFAYLAILLIGYETATLPQTAPVLSGWITAALVIATLLLLLLSIRRVYRQGWFWSMLKFTLGGLIYLVVLSTALAATFLITLALPD